MINFIKKVKEKKKPPQLANLDTGEIFVIESERNQLYIRTRFDGADYRGWAKWFEGGDGEIELHDAIKKIQWNRGKEFYEDDYVVAIRLFDGEECLLHKSLSVIPMNCELHYQEKEEYIL